MSNKVTIEFFNQAIIEGFAKKFAQKQKSAMALKLAQLGLADRMKLIKSITTKVNKRFGMVESITWKYAYYGFFHEHGATNAFGNGTNLPAQKWISDVINPEMEALADQIAEYYAEVAIQNLTQNFK